jgi:hypothetical protein
MRLVMAFAVALVLASSVRAAPAPTAKKAVDAPVAKPSGDGADYAPAVAQLPLPLGSTKRDTNKTVIVGRADRATAARIIRALHGLLLLARSSATGRMTDTILADGMEAFASCTQATGPILAVGDWSDERHEIRVRGRKRPVVGCVTRDEEDWRLTRLTGAMTGYVFEAYLGDGFSFRLSVGVDRERWLPFVAPTLDWYATEEVCYCYGWDPIAGFGLSWRRNQEDSTKER